MGKERRQKKKNKFRITGYVDGREYSGLKERKRYYREPYHMQEINNKGKNGKSIWLNFVEHELVEDCPHCNPDLDYLHRINKTDESVVCTNFNLITNVEPKKRKINYLKTKQNMKTCVDYPRYDHHNHNMNSFKYDEDALARKAYSATPEKDPEYLKLYGSSLRNKFKFASKKNSEKIARSKTPKKKDPRIYGKSRFGNTYVSLYKNKSPLRY